MQNQTKVPLPPTPYPRITINYLKFIIGLTIFRRWRAVHGAEEHPSPSGFAMVFQKTPFSPKGLNNGNIKNGVGNPKTVNVTNTPSKANNNKIVGKCNGTTTSTLTYMVNIQETFFISKMIKKEEIDYDKKKIGKKLL